MQFRSKGLGMLRLTGVSKAYPGVRALDAVSVELEDGEIGSGDGEAGSGISTEVLFSTAIFCCACLIVFIIFLIRPI